MLERKLLFFPSHKTLLTPELELWEVDGAPWGLTRHVQDPQAVWLFCHGNGGQAGHRTYALPHFPETDAVYILEYPGYGGRKGWPRKTSFNTAARQAYQQLRLDYPNLPIGLVGESIGSGPVCHLASEEPPPDKIILVTPFDSIYKVANRYAPSLLVSLVIRSNWDNVQAMNEYQGPVDIYGAERDQVIPLEHAKQLASQIPQARFVVIPGGHNEWSYTDAVQFTMERR